MATVKEIKKQESIEESILKDLATRPGEKIKPLSTAFSEAKAKLARLEKALAEYAREKEGAQSTLTRTIAESMKAIEKGARPKDDDVRGAKDRLSRVEGWIS